METAGFTYGADVSGPVWGFLFDRGERTLALDSAAALEWMQDPARPDGKQFIWLHFNLTNTAREKWLKGHAKLADEFYETLHQGSRSTRIELADDTLIAVVNDVMHDFSFDAPDISTLWVNVARPSRAGSSFGRKETADRAAAREGLFAPAKGKFRQ